METFGRGCKTGGIIGGSATRPGTELAILATLWQDSIRLYFRFDEQKIQFRMQNG